MVIHGRLLVTGGYDEVERHFDGGAEFLDATTLPLGGPLCGDGKSAAGGGGGSIGRRGDQVPCDTTTDMDYEALFPDSDSGDEGKIGDGGGCGNGSGGDSGGDGGGGAGAGAGAGGGGGGGAIMFDAVGGDEYERQLKESFDRERIEQLAHDRAIRAHNGMMTSSASSSSTRPSGDGSGGSRRGGAVRRRLGGDGCGFQVMGGYAMPCALHAHSMFALPRLTFAG